MLDTYFLFWGKFNITSISKPKTVPYGSSIKATYSLKINYSIQIKSNASIFIEYMTYGVTLAFTIGTKKNVSITIV